MKKWRCEVCGYIHTGDEPPVKCPVCGAPQSAFILIEDPGATPLPDDGAETPLKAPPSGEQGKWKCEVCDTIHTGSQAPATCPVCAAPQDRFERLEENIVPAKEKKERRPAQTHRPVQANPLNQIASKAEMLTRLHGHPIAVHIPNGVLPVAFLFTLLSVVFKSEALAAAAKYNTIFVCLSMPLILITGGIDWVNRFNAQMTRVFKIKMVCGGAVTTLSLLLSLWWMIQPNIYLGGEANAGLFLFLNLLNLSIAAVAGFYGGKLVFRD